MTDDATTYQEMRDRILGLLQQHVPRAVPIQTIARELEIDRRTAAKYLDFLALSGDVSMERFGPKKLYRPSKRLPLLEIVNHLPVALVILDADLQVNMVNASFVATLGLHPGHTLVGAPLFDLNLPFFSDPAVQRNIERIRRSEIYLDKMQMMDERTDRVFLAAFAPIVSPTAGEGIMVSLQDITAVKNAETDLKDSEKKMATLFESVPSGIILFAADGAILNANHASLQVLGLRTPADMRITSIFDIACYRTKLELLIREGRATETELACDFERLRREQGIQSTKSGIAYFDVAFTPVLHDSRGAAKEFAILFKDITAKRRAEKELKERLAGVSSNLPGIIYQFYARDTGEWGIYYVDARSADIFGLNPWPVRDWFQRFSACIAPEDRDWWDESTHETVHRRVPWDFEGKFLKPSGGEIYFRGISQPVRLEHETVWNGIFLDITDRKMAEEALQQSHFLETRYRSFFEDTCNGILIYEPVDEGRDYLITDANRVTANLLRTNRADLVGKRLFEEFPDLSTPEIHALLLRILTTERPEAVAPLRYRERDDFPLISHYVFKLPSGELASFMIDVSEVLEGAEGLPPAVKDATNRSNCD
ncbi:PAS domain S-box protein [Methanosphaerula palustris]|uniref:histidine kinase n=1 Tax=Methanosphaerula palustris (strain ATCC BAA-1556 / DSM 19958 / E1-9c) TaxID=521011 RepID=B8GI01_METPE|nr:PAS domain S-box protein [Methanosphaerula palustris]ACL16741.1 putative PAS/PAC sensor protein [Methanosphaerula palustris E1-9c]